LSAGDGDDILNSLKGKCEELSKKGEIGAGVPEMIALPPFSLFTLHSSLFKGGTR
jgi:hypothetical protein